MQEDKEERIHINKINPLDMNTWKFLIKAHIKAKGWMDALVTPRPKGEKAVLNATLRLGRRTPESNQYLDKIENLKKDWDRKNEKTYDYLLRCCQDNEAAMNIAMDIENSNFTAKQLLDALESRFDRQSLSTLVQKKERIFFNMKIASSQTAEEFIEQLIKARRELIGYGCHYITLEGHCRNILLEAMLEDQRFREQANAFSAASGVTWKKMVSEVTARELNETEKHKSKKSESTTSNNSIALPQNIIRKLSALVDSHTSKGGSKWKGKKKFSGNCFICGKPGHRARTCKSGKKDSDASSGGCSYCGRQGHSEEACRKKKYDQGSTRSSDDGPEKKRARTVDEVLEQLTNKNFMMRHVPSTNVQKSSLLTLDSGATTHMVPKSIADSVERGNTNLVEKEIQVATAKSGVHFKTIAQGQLGSLRNALITNDGVLEEGVASIPQFDEDGYFILCGGGNAMILSEDMQVLATAPLVNKTYRFSVADLVNLPTKHKALLGSAQPEENLTLWHKRLGHGNRRNLGKAITDGKIIGPTPAAAKNSKVGLCDACVKAKQTRHSYSRSVAATTKEKTILVPLERRIRRISTDLKGPMSVTGVNGELYLQMFTEDDTSWRVGKTLKAKSCASDALQEYTTDLATEDQSLVEYHADGAKELVSKEIRAILVNTHTRLTYSPPYTPELNGIAERSNRTIWEASDAMLNNCVLPLTFWIYSCLYAVCAITCYLHRLTRGG